MADQSHYVNFQNENSAQFSLPLSEDKADENTFRNLHSEQVTSDYFKQHPKHLEEYHRYFYKNFPDHNYLNPNQQEHIYLESDFLTVVLSCPNHKYLIIGTESGDLFKFNVETQKIEKHLKSAHEGTIRAMEFYRNEIYDDKQKKFEGGLLVVTVGSDGLYKIWDLARNYQEWINTFKVYKEDEQLEDPKIDCFCIAKYGDIMVSAGNDKNVTIHKLNFVYEGGKKLTVDMEFVQLQKFNSNILSLSISAYAEKIIISLQNCEFKVYNVELNEEIINFSCGSDGVTVNKTILLNEEKIFAICSDGKIRCWYIDQVNSYQTYSGHFGSILDFDISLDGKKLVSVGSDLKIKVWNQNLGFEEYILEPWGIVNFVKIANNGSIIYSFDDENQLKTWKLTRDEIKQKQVGDIIQLWLSPDENYLLAVITHFSPQDLKNVYDLVKYDTKNITEIAKMTFKQAILAIDISSDGELVAIGFDSGLMHMVMFEKFQMIYEIKALDNKKPSDIKLKFISNNTQLMVAFSGQNQGKLYIIDLNQRNVLKEIDLKTVTKIDFAYLEQNQKIAVSGENWIKMYDVVNQFEKIKDCSIKFSVNITDIGLSPNEEFIVLAGEDKKVNVWYWKYDIEINQTFSGQMYNITQVEVLGDSKRIVSVAPYESISIYNIDTGLLDRKFLIDENISDVSFNKAGDRIFSSSSSDYVAKGKISIWDIYDQSNVWKFINNIENLTVDQVCKIWPNVHEMFFVRKNNFHALGQDIFFHFVIKQDKDSLSKLFQILQKEGYPAIQFKADIYGKTSLEYCFLKNQELFFNLFLDYLSKQKKQINSLENSLQIFQRGLKWKSADMLTFLNSRICTINFPDTMAYIIKDYEGLCAQKLEIQAFDVFSKFPKLEPDFTNEDLGAARLKVELIDLSDALDISNPNNKLMETLVNLPHEHEIFKSSVLEAILDYKWQSYGYRIFIHEAIFYLLFMIVLLISAVWVVPNKMHEKKWLKWHYTMLISTGVLIIFDFILILKEIKQIIRMSPKKYFMSPWNILDSINVISLTLTIIVDFLALITIPHNHLRILNSITIFLCFIRLISFCRGFQEVAYYIRMIFTVVYDIRYFLSIMLGIMFTLGFSVFVLDNISNQKQWMFMQQLRMFDVVYRLILGDFDKFNGIMNNSVSKTLAWVFFFFSTFFLMIIMLNLLISILSDSYQRISANKDQENNYERCNLLFEIDNDLSESKIQQLKDNDIIGKYLFKISSEGVEQEEGGTQMQQYIEKLEKKLLEQIENDRNNTNTQIENLSSDVQYNQNELNRNIENIEENLNKFEEKTNKNFQQLKELLENIVGQKDSLILDANRNQRSSKQIDKTKNQSRRNI